MFVRILTPVLMILFGLGAGILIARQRNVEWKYYGMGALTFIGSQLLHIPFNTWVLNPILGKVAETFSDKSFLITAALALGLSAGIFEETSRYLVYRFGIKGARQWKDALMFGAGHGGIEAILLGVLTFLTVLNIFSLLGKDLSAVVPVEQLPLARQQIETFWAVPWYGVLLGAGERVFAICFHLAASVLVLQVFRRKNILWLFGAVGLHTLLNALAVYGSPTWGPYVTEGVLAVLALGCVGIIFRLKTPEDFLESEPSPLVMPPVLEQSEDTPRPITSDQLEDSKYV
jgi:uncharacterized membrane protein YhfC